MRVLPLYAAPPELELDRAAPSPLNHSCTACSLREKARAVCMAPELTGPDEGPTLWVLGQGPGDEEDRQGRPFVGASGTYFRQLVHQLWGGPVVLDNALRCAPGARKIAPSMRSACLQYSAAVYRDARPARILALGHEAVASLTGASFSMYGTRRGYALTRDGVPAFFLIHPAAGLRNRFVRQWFEEDLHWALTAQVDGPPRAAVVMFVTTPAEAERMVQDVQVAGGCSWDLETFGAPFNREFAVLNMSVAPQGAEYAYVLERPALEDPAVREHVRRMLEDPSLEGDGFNLKFDQLCMRAKFGIRARCSFDAYLVRSLNAPEGVELKLKKSLPLVGMGGAKDEVEEYLTAGVRALNKLAKDPKRAPVDFYGVSVDELVAGVERVRRGDNPRRYAYAAIPPDLRGRYNGGDAISAGRLRRHLESRYGELPHVRRVWDGTLRAMAHAVAAMEFNGIAVNRQAIRDLQVMMAQRVEQARAEMGKYVPPGVDFNPNKPEDVADVLFNRLGLRATSFTEKTGQPQVTADVLEALKHPFADAVVTYRKASKFKAQYADGMEGYVQDDGRIHANFKIVGTGTGRPSGEDPNLLNIPRPKTPEGKLCRDVFCAGAPWVGDEDFDDCLLEADYSQIELRVAAMLSRDRLMRALFEQGVDFHLATAQMIAPLFGVDPAVVDKDHKLRDDSKVVNFSTLYGDPPAGLAFKLRTTKQKAVALQDAILGKFVDLKRFTQERLRFGRLHGHCRTWWNGEDYRVRSLHEIGGHDQEKRETAERSTWNTPIQGTAAEFTNASLGAIQGEIERRGWEGEVKLVLTVYDSILLQVRRRRLREVALAVKGIMEGWPSDGVPLVAELKAGWSWGSMAPYDPEAEAA